MTVNAVGYESPGVIRQFSDSQIDDLSYYILTRMATDGIPYASTLNANTLVGGNLIGSFTNTYRQGTVGSSDISILSTTSNIYQTTSPYYDNTYRNPDSGPGAPNYIGLNVTGTTVTLQSNLTPLANIASNTLDLAVSGGPNSYYLGTSAPSDGGTWTSIGTFNDTREGSAIPFNTYYLWKKTNMGTSNAHIRPTYIDTDGSIKEFSNTDIQHIIAYVENEFLSTGKSQYILQESSPSPGTWVAVGTVQDTIANVSEGTSYGSTTYSNVYTSGGYEGVTEINYVQIDGVPTTNYSTIGPPNVDYTGLAFTSYDSTQYTGLGNYLDAQSYSNVLSYSQVYTSDVSFTTEASYEGTAFVQYTLVPTYSTDAVYGTLFATYSTYIRDLGYTEYDSFINYLKTNYDTQFILPNYTGYQLSYVSNIDYVAGGVDYEHLDDYLTDLQYTGVADYTGDAPGGGVTVYDSFLNYTLSYGGPGPGPVIYSTTADFDGDDFSTKGNRYTATYTSGEDVYSGEGQFTQGYWGVFIERYSANYEKLDTYSGALFGGAFLGQFTTVNTYVGEIGYQGLAFNDPVYSGFVTFPPLLDPDSIFTNPYEFPPTSYFGVSGYITTYAGHSGYDTTANFESKTPENYQGLVYGIVFNPLYTTILSYDGAVNYKDAYVAFDTESIFISNDIYIGPFVNYISTYEGEQGIEYTTTFSTGATYTQEFTAFGQLYTTDFEGNNFTSDYTGTSIYAGEYVLQQDYTITYELDTTFFGSYDTVIVYTGDFINPDGGAAYTNSFEGTIFNLNYDTDVPYTNEYELIGNYTTNYDIDVNYTADYSVTEIYGTEYELVVNYTGDYEGADLYETLYNIVADYNTDYVGVVLYTNVFSTTANYTLDYDATAIYGAAVLYNVLPVYEGPVLNDYTGAGIVPGLTANYTSGEFTSGYLNETYQDDYTNLEVGNYDSFVGRIGYIENIYSGYARQYDIPLSYFSLFLSPEADLLPYIGVAAYELVNYSGSLIYIVGEAYLGTGSYSEYARDSDVQYILSGDYIGNTYEAGESYFGELIFADNYINFISYTLAEYIADYITAQPQVFTTNYESFVNYGTLFTGGTFTAKGQSYVATSYIDYVGPGSYETAYTSTIDIAYEGPAPNPITYDISYSTPVEYSATEYNLLEEFSTPYINEFLTTLYSAIGFNALSFAVSYAGTYGQIDLNGLFNSIDYVQTYVGPGPTNVSITYHGEITSYISEFNTQIVYNLNFGQGIFGRADYFGIDEYHDDGNLYHLSYTALTYDLIFLGVPNGFTGAPLIYFGPVYDWDYERNYITGSFDNVYLGLPTLQNYVNVFDGYDASYGGPSSYITEFGGTNYESFVGFAGPAPAGSPTASYLAGSIVEYQKSFFPVDVASYNNYDSGALLVYEGPVDYVSIQSYESIPGYFGTADYAGNVTLTGSSLQQNNDSGNIYNTSTTTNNGFTITGWSKRTGGDAQLSNLVELVKQNDPNDTRSLYVQFNTNYTLRLGWYSNISTDTPVTRSYTKSFTVGESPSGNTWFYWALVSDASTYRFRWTPDNGTTWYEQSNAQPAVGIFTPDEYQLLGNRNVPTYNTIGNTAFVKMYNTALSNAEITTEATSAYPVRLANLWSSFANDPTIDLSGNNRDWTIEGSTTLSSDLPFTDTPGNYQLNGSVDYSAQDNTMARIGTALLTGIPLTMFAWVKPYSVPAPDVEPGDRQYGIINLDSASTNQQYIRLGLARTPDDTSGRPIGLARLRNTAVSTAYGQTTIQLNTWTSLAATFSDENITGNLNLFVNGILDQSQTITVVPTGLNETLIGREAIFLNNENRNFDGKIGTVALWNTPLTDAEIQNLHSGISPLNIKPDNLVAFWPGTTENISGNDYLVDVSGNNNDALLQNGAVATSDSPPDLDATGVYTTELKYGATAYESGSTYTVDYAGGAEYTSDFQSFINYTATYNIDQTYAAEYELIIVYQTDFNNSQLYTADYESFINYNIDYTGIVVYETDFVSFNLYSTDYVLTSSYTGEYQVTYTSDYASPANFTSNFNAFVATLESYGGILSFDTQFSTFTSYSSDYALDVLYTTTYQATYAGDYDSTDIYETVFTTSTPYDVDYIGDTTFQNFTGDTVINYTGPVGGATYVGTVNTVTDYAGIEYSGQYDSSGYLDAGAVQYASQLVTSLTLWKRVA